MLADGVEDPVHLGGPAAVVGVVHLLHEVVHSLLLRLVQGQGLADVGDVVEGLQLGHAGAQHHGEQVDEEVGVLADGQIGLVAHLLEPEGGTEWRGGRDTEGEIGMGESGAKEWGNREGENIDI